MKRQASVQIMQQRTEGTLEWNGQGQPGMGDSGGGVFVNNTLVGVISGSSTQGGMGYGASVTSQRVQRLLQIAASQAIRTPPSNMPAPYYPQQGMNPAPYPYAPGAYPPGGYPPPNTYPGMPPPGPYAPNNSLPPASGTSSQPCF